MNQEFKPKQLPAFPVKMTGPCMFAGVELPAGAEIEWAGMTLRDYFAVKAMQSMCQEVSRYDQFDSCSKDAYKMADAMLEARQK